MKIDLLVPGNKTLDDLIRGCVEDLKVGEVIGIISHDGHLAPNVFIGVDGSSAGGLIVNNLCRYNEADEFLYEASDNLIIPYFKIRELQIKGKNYLFNG